MADNEKKPANTNNEASEINKPADEENKADKEKDLAAERLKAKDIFLEEQREKQKKRKGIYGQFAAKVETTDMVIDTSHASGFAQHEDGTVYIIEDGKPNPKLDPLSSEFNEKLYADYLQGHSNEITLLSERIEASLNSLLSVIGNIYNSIDYSSITEQLSIITQVMQQSLYPVLNGLASAFGRADFHRFTEKVRAIYEALPTTDEINYYEKFLIAAQYIVQTTPAYKDKELSFDDIEKEGLDDNGNIIGGSLLEQILSEIKLFVAAMETELQKKKYSGKDFAVLKKQGLAEDGTIIDGSILAQLLDDTKKALATQITVTTTNATIERIKHYPIKEIKTPLDKTNHLFYGINPPQPQKDTNGQWSYLPVQVGKDKHPATVYYSYFVDSEQLEKLGISKKFTQKDFTICSVINAFRESGNSVITFTQLHKALGNKATPNSQQLHALQDNLTRLLTTTIALNTKDIAEAYNIENYNEFIGSLLPIQIINEKAVINGQTVNGYIKILEEPPLITLAKNTNQITAIQPQMLAVNITHNEMFYAIFNYLVTEISHIKNPNYTRRNKILYSTIYSEIGIKEDTNASRQKAKALDIIEKILNHFKNCGFISNYKTETTKSTGETGIVICWDNSIAADTK